MDTSKIKKFQSFLIIYMSFLFTYSSSNGINSCNYDEATNKLGANKCDPAYTSQSCSGCRTCSSSGYCSGESTCISSTATVNCSTSSLCYVDNCSTCIPSSGKLLFKYFSLLLFNL